MDGLRPAPRRTMWPSSPASRVGRTANSRVSATRTRRSYSRREIRSRHQTTPWTRAVALPCVATPRRGRDGCPARKTFDRGPWPSRGLAAPRPPSRATGPRWRTRPGHPSHRRGTEGRTLWPDFSAPASRCGKGTRARDRPSAHRVRSPPRRGATREQGLVGTSPRRGGSCRRRCTTATLRGRRGTPSLRRQLRRRRRRNHSRPGSAGREVSETTAVLDRSSSPREVLGETNRGVGGALEGCTDHSARGTASAEASRFASSGRPLVASRRPRCVRRRCVPNCASGERQTEEGSCKTQLRPRATNPAISWR